MPLLDDETRGEVETRLAALAGPVKLVLFADPADLEGPSAQLSRLLHEVSELSEKVVVEEHVLAVGDPAATRYAIRRAPAIAVEGERDHGIRYYGLPLGFEFGTLIEVMGDAAAGTAELPEAVRAGLARLREPVHIQVFSTPT